MQNPELDNDDYVSPEAQKIIDDELARQNGDDPTPNPDDGDDDPLPSDEGDDGDKLFANKYKSVDELRKGIENIGSDLPQYVIDGMSDEALEQHYTELNKAKSGGEPKSGRKHADDPKPNDDPKPDDKKDPKPSGS